MSPALAHTVTIGGVVTPDVGTVQDGVNMIANSESQSGTITMTSNETVTGNIGVTISGGNVTLNLNNHTIINAGYSGTAIAVTDGSLTLQDTGMGGKVEATDNYGVGVYVGGGIANISGGTVNGGENGVEVDGGGTANISGGSVSGGDRGVYVHKDFNHGTAEISGDAIVIGKTGVQVEDSTFTMDGGTVGSTVEGGAAVDGTGTIVLNGGTIYGSVPDGVVPGAGVKKEAAPYPTPDPTPTPTPDPAPAPVPDPDPDPAPDSDPLAGPASAATLLEELFRRAGASGDLWSWAVENGLIDEDADGEEIVTVGLLRAILTRYAEAFGGNAVAVEDLTTLTGGDADIVRNCRAVLDEFFGE